jgi:hypothetical protein
MIDAKNDIIGNKLYLQRGKSNLIKLLNQFLTVQRKEVNLKNSSIIHDVE